MSPISYPKASGCVMSQDGAKVAPTPGATIDMADFLAAGVDTSPFKGLIPRFMDSVRASFPLLFSEHGPVHSINTLLSLMTATEVSDMVRIVNEAF